MFDIGFSEILVIFVLALIVLGPEKLPRVASQVGRWMGRARAMARQFREQLEEEITLEQARKLQPPSPRSPEREVASSLTDEAAHTVDPPIAPDVTALPPVDVPGAAFGGSTQPQSIRPPTFSHAHPTDSMGRPVSTLEEPAADPDPRQQDWVSELDPDSPRTAANDAAYAAPHERGT